MCFVLVGKCSRSPKHIRVIYQVFSRVLCEGNLKYPSQSLVHILNDVAYVLRLSACSINASLGLLF